MPSALSGHPAAPSACSTSALRRIDQHAHMPRIREPHHVRERHRRHQRQKNHPRRAIRGAPRLASKTWGSSTPRSHLLTKELRSIAPQSISRNTTSPAVSANKRRVLDPLLTPIFLHRKEDHPKLAQDPPETSPADAFAGTSPPPAHGKSLKLHSSPNRIPLHSDPDHAHRASHPLAADRARGSSGLFALCRLIPSRLVPTLYRPLA